MVGWPWLLAAVVGVTLLQLLLYRRLRGGSGRTAGRTGRSDRSEDRGGRTERRSAARRSAFGPRGTAAFAAERDPPDPPGDADGRPCPHCGTLNDPDGAFTYCAECVRPLP